MPYTMKVMSIDEHYGWIDVSMAQPGWEDDVEEYSLNNLSDADRNFWKEVQVGDVVEFEIGNGSGTLFDFSIPAHEPRALAARLARIEAHLGLPPI